MYNLPITITPFNVSAPLRIENECEKTGLEVADYVCECHLCEGTVVCSLFCNNLYGRCSVCGQFYYSEESIISSYNSLALEAVRYFRTNYFDIHPPTLFRKISSNILREIKYMAVPCVSFKKIREFFKEGSGSRFIKMYLSNMRGTKDNPCWVFPLEYAPGILEGFVVYGSNNKFTTLRIGHRVDESHKPVVWTEKVPYKFSTKYMEDRCFIKLHPEKVSEYLYFKEAVDEGLDDLLGFRKDRGVCIKDPQLINTDETARLNLLKA